MYSPTENQTLAELDLLNRLIGERIAQVRKATGLSLDELGSRFLGVTGQQVARYERGKSRVPVADLLNVLMHVKLTPNEFAMPVMATLLWYREEGRKHNIDPSAVHMGMESLFFKPKTSKKKA